MKMCRGVVLGFLLVLVLVVCGSGEDVQRGTKSNPGVDVKDPGMAGDKSVEKEKPAEVEKKLSPVVKDDIVVGNEGGLKNGSDAGKLGLKKKLGGDVQKSSDGKTQGNESEQIEKKKIVEDPKDGLNMGGGASKKSEADLKKEKPQGEECDMSNRCTDVGKILVACLRVPGNDASALSLLIQNKGKGTMIVKISVPTFVKVERTSVELKETESQKVKVSVRKDGKDGDVVLTSGNGSCSLSLKSLIANNNGSEEVTTLQKSNYLSVLTENKPLSFMFLGLMVMIASVAVGVLVRIRKRSRLATIPNYQKLGMELPISVGREEIVKSSDVHDGWDSGWDDNWDDEEAPMSPMPVTPSLSSKGLASRKLNKD